jgi:DNA-binding MarR family transcriptional regulator
MAAHEELPPPTDPRVVGLYAVLQYVRPLHRHVAQAVADRLEGTGVTVAARAVLERLVLGGPQTVPHAAQALALPRQAVQRVVNELAALGLVETRPNPMHRTSHLIAPTASGVRQLEAIRAQEDVSLAALARRVAPEDVAAAVRVLDALTQHFRDEVAARRAAGESAPDQTTKVDADVHHPHPQEDQP